MTEGGGAKILVIKLGALGDVIQALGPMAAIRAHHPNDHISILTTAPFAALIEAAYVADRVIIDARPSTFDVGGWLGLRRLLRNGGFSRVYDLQTSGRSNRYFRLFWPGPMPEWSGIAPGCSHPHANPLRDGMHTLERQAEQLAMASIPDVPLPNLSNIKADTSRFGLPDAYMVLVPGGAAHRPDKRWPAECYGALAQAMAESGQTCVVVGSRAEKPIAAAITDMCPGAHDLMGETDLIELVSIMRGASAAIGNDSGPMHAAAVVGTPSVVLYAHASDPALCAQRGPAVDILRVPSLDDLEVRKVIDAINALSSS